MSDNHAPQAPWDYIIVGSGAGGAPLAARLAKKGYRVLVLEAGTKEYPDESAIPAFHGAASEDPKISWEFFIKHYTDENLQKADTKYDKEKQGIFYPRAAGIGGCTIHNAMITIAGPPRGWDQIAEITGDDTWRGDQMRQYFQRMENCNYVRRPQKIENDQAMHGFDGWLHTSWIDVTLGFGDHELIKVILAAIHQAKLSGIEEISELTKTFVQKQFREHFDPNDAITQRQSPEGVILVPIAVNHGQRSSPRDFLLQAQTEVTAAGVGALTIESDTLVTEILWETVAGKPPRAVGVKTLKGASLYQAHPTPNQNPGTPGEFHCQREVILCGGAFNTPQLLKLSGIGPKAELDALGIPVRVDLPGVGENLQDRNEVTVINKMDREFALLQNAAFGDPTVKDDKELDKWKTTKTGVYAANGVVLAIMKRSSPNLPEPDIFIFGVPGYFKGYQRGYSSNFVTDHKTYNKDVFTWAILKAYTSNRGTVRLRSKNPLERPEINFKYFGDGQDPNNEDMLAILNAVKFVRAIDANASTVVKEELWPGPATDTDDKVKQWIKRETWGHHACGTCKMGSADDDDAVVDSRFRVRGVTGLRIVDASIFPYIPGMFIVSHIYMISEKAADVIDEDAHGGPDNAVYPRVFKELEADALVKRRTLAGVPGNAADPLKDAVGLALSGGGIRSATFNLGVLQALARQKLLRTVDFMSTVSGGGYIGSFLGRFYTRYHPSEKNAARHVEGQLTDPYSPEIGWLRAHANYISPNGAADATLNLGIFLRNFVTLHFVLCTFLFTFFGLANLARFHLFPWLNTLISLPAATDLPMNFVLREGFPIQWSPWFMLVEIFLLISSLPLMLGFWLASQERSNTYQPTALIVSFILAGVLLFAGLSALGRVALQPLFGILVLVFALFVVERAWIVVKGRLRGSGSHTEAVRLTLPRTLLTGWLGTATFGTLMAFAFALADTIGYLLYLFSQGQHPAATVAQLAVAITAMAPVLQIASRFLADRGPSNAATAGLAEKLKGMFLPWVICLIVVGLWMILLSFVSHLAYDGGAQIGVGIGATALTLILSVVITRAIAFINLSSLQSYYAARLGRTYLGATNPERRYTDAGKNVTEDVPGDDLPLHDYAPHVTGGPIHIINVTVNQTADKYSHRDACGRHGDIVAVTLFGISIGIQSHARWTKDNMKPDKRNLAPIRNPTGQPHPFKNETTDTEDLTLKNWIAISGAAISAGRGAATNVGTSLLMGLANLRTSYWWRSGEEETQLPGRGRIGGLDGLLMKLVDKSFTFFLPQALLLYELFGHYAGPWAPYWYLSDGGFFENLAVYELLRRRVRTIVCCDAGQDGDYVLEDLGALIRKARIDFHAEIRFLSRADISASANIPPGVKPYLGTLDELKPPPGQPFSKIHACLALVTYEGDAQPASILLYIKLSMTGDESPDVLNYKAMHAAFPHESTGDQFFDEPQWESYRALGEHAAAHLLVPGADGELWLKEYPL